MEVETWGIMLHEARLSGRPVSQLSEKFKDFTTTDAYRIQDVGLAQRLKTGEVPLGYKMGLTSEAKRQQMNLASPLYGVLTNKMEIPQGGEFSLRGSIHPKIEPEIGFVVANELKGSVTRDQVLAACSKIFAALEILDSRYRQFKYFSLQDVIADNSSSSHFVRGESLDDFSSLDLNHLKMTMSINGQVAHEGRSDAISGDPVLSVVQLVDLLAQNGKALPAGSLVLAGAATPAVALEPGMKVNLEVEGLAPVNVSIGGEES